MEKKITYPLAASLLGLAASLSAWAGEPPLQAGPTQNMELSQANWFDGREFRQGTLYINEGRFSASRPERIDQRMNLQGRYLVAPLAEAHNHNLQNVWGFDRFAARYIEQGVFYAAMLCGDPPGVAPLRERAGRVDTPDVEFVTACITSSDGHPLGMMLNDEAPDAPKTRFEDVADKAILVMDNVDDVVRKWPLVRQRPGSLIKLIMSYHERPALRQDPRNHGRLGVSAEVAAAIVAQAHRDGLRVSAHVDSAADFAAAVSAGVDQIAHLPGYHFHHNSRPEHYLISAEQAAEAARGGVQVITTTAASQLFRASPEQMQLVRDTQARNLRTLIEAGVPLLLGSDVFMETALAEYRSLRVLQVLEPAALLRIATVDTARAIFPLRRLGCFEPGCEASFLVLEDNPLNRPEALERPLLRVKSGHLLRPAAR